MKRWAFLTLFLYLCFMLLTPYPLLYLAFEYPKIPQNNPLNVYLEIYHAWFYWLWVGLLLACQAILLLVRVKGTDPIRRPRWKVAVPAVTSAFLMALLVVGLVLSVIEAGQVDLGNRAGYGLILFLVGTWFGWCLFFYLISRWLPTGDLNSWLARVILAGSILEFLIAVPCHVIVRRRNECCGGILTMVGLSTGLSLMFLAFGPAVLFLVWKRYQQINRRPWPRPGTGGLSLPNGTRSRSQPTLSHP
jgi:hypothetical protein